MSEPLHAEGQKTIERAHLLWRLHRTHTHEYLELCDHLMKTPDALDAECAAIERARVAAAYPPKTKPAPPKAPVQAELF